MAGICDLVIAENVRRERAGADRPLYLLYDQVYWMLTFGDARHVNPVVLRPAMLPYTVLIDAISKSFAATGLRVGWAVGPADIIKRMSDVLGHVGAWAPRAEQIATAHLLSDDAGMDAFHAKMRPEVQKRLDALATVLRTLEGEGLPVKATVPQGAIYLSARFDLAGARTAEGEQLGTNESMRPSVAVGRSCRGPVPGVRFQRRRRLVPPQRRRGLGCGYRGAVAEAREALRGLR